MTVAVVEDPDFTLYWGDCTEVLRELDAGSIDVCITDPPYNVGKDYGAGISDNRGDYIEWLRSVFTETARVVRDGLVFFPGTTNIYDVPAVLEGTGFHVVRTLATFRREFAGDKWSGGPAMCWEPVVWASKLAAPHFNRVFGHWGRDCFPANSPRHELFYGTHPCPKPVDIMRWLVGLFAPLGGSVVDPFAGTGTTAQACRERGVFCVGIELDADSAAMCRKRLSQLSLLEAIPSG